MPKVVFTCDECGFESYYKHGSCPDCEVKQLRAIVAKLPKTADGVPVVPGMELYYPGSVGVTESEAKLLRFTGPGDSWSDMYMCYSTREAAEAARGA